LAETEGADKRPDMWTSHVMELIQDTLRNEEGIPEFLARVVLSVTAIPRPAAWMERISVSTKPHPSHDLSRILSKFAEKLEEIPPHIRKTLDMDHLVSELLNRFPDRFEGARNKATRKIRKAKEQGKPVTWPLVTAILTKAAKDYPPSPPAFKPRPPPGVDADNSLAQPGPRKSGMPGEQSYQRGRVPVRHLKEVSAPAPTHQLVGADQPPPETHVGAESNGEEEENASNSHLNEDLNL
jgi:hypothetical protein